MSTEGKQGVLLRIPPKEIIPNRENPRLLFDEEDLGILKKSISEVGILVPLTVYRRESDGRFVLLDGERRRRCAVELELKAVPCNQVEQPTQITNILWMFNIHNTRKEWELVPTALKLQTVIRLLGDKSNTELGKLTSMSATRVAECKRILKYPKRFLDLAVVPRPEERVTGDFFSQMARFLEEVEKVPTLNRKYPRDRITEIMIEKYREGNLKAILDFRVMKKALAEAHRRGIPEDQVLKKTDDYFKSETMSPMSYFDSLTGTAFSISKISKSAAKLTSWINELSKTQTRDEKEFLQNLRELRKAIDRLLKE